MAVKIGISTYWFQQKYGMLEALKIAKEIGADAVDIGLWWLDYRNKDSIYSKSDDEIWTYFTEAGKKAKQLGIEISQTHGRMRGYQNNPQEDMEVRENARRDCMTTAALGAQVCVMHGASTNVLGLDVKAEQMRKINFDMFCDILCFAKTNNVQIATETLGDAPKFGCCSFFGDIGEFVESYQRICAVENNAKYFSVCVDTGHCNKAVKYNQPSSGDTIRRLGSSVSVLHLNDNDGMTDQHKLPLGGNIDWKDVLAALKEINYNGVYNLELNLKHFGAGMEKNYARFAIEVMRNMLL